MHHGADVYGSMLVIYGGFSGEDKSILGDIAIFDLSKKMFLLTVKFREKKLDSSRDFIEE